MNRSSLYYRYAGIVDANMSGSFCMFLGSIMYSRFIHAIYSLTLQPTHCCITMLLHIFCRLLGLLRDSPCVVTFHVPKSCDTTDDSPTLHVKSIQLGTVFLPSLNQGRGAFFSLLVGKFPTDGPTATKPPSRPPSLHSRATHRCQSHQQSFIA